ncbi:MAG: FG-GAP-like repeat-containing protein, partial [Thermoplasmata archaeon]
MKEKGSSCLLHSTAPVIFILLIAIFSLNALFYTAPPSLIRSNSYENAIPLINSYQSTKLMPSGSRSFFYNISGTSNFGNVTVTLDFNEDGLDDLAVGAPENNSGVGAVFLYNGSEGGLSPDPWVFYPTFTSGSPRFGFSLAVGDIKGDGTKNDLIVGAPWNNSGAGCVYIFYGGPSEDNISDLKIDSPDNGRFGYSVSAGNFNGTGPDELVVGEPYATASNKGRIYIYDQLASNSFANSYVEGGGNANYGYCVKCGYFNDSSVAHLFFTSGSALYVLYGNNNGILGSPFQITNTGITSSTIIYTGQYCNDSFEELILCNPDALASSGTVQIFRFNAAGSFAHTWTLSGRTGEKFGSSIAIGEYNNDGIPDLFVGAAANNSNNGIVYVFSNNSSVPVLTIPPSSSGFFGAALAAGRFNNDTEWDLAVGVPAYNSNEGCIRVYYSPNSTNLSVLPISINRTESVNITIMGYDLENNSTAKAWLWYASPNASWTLWNSAIPYTASNPTTSFWNTTFSTNSSSDIGLFNFSIAINDSDGFVSSRKNFTNVLEVFNKPPAVTAMSLTPPSVSRGSNVTINASFTDDVPSTCSGEIRYKKNSDSTWTSLGSANRTGNNFTLNWTVPVGISSGEYNISIVVTDGNGANVTYICSTGLIISNANPVINNTLISNTTPVRGNDTVVIKVWAWDLESPNSTFNVSIGYYNTTGVFQQIGYMDFNSSDSSWQFNWTPGGTLWLGNYTFSVNVNDTEGGSRRENLTSVVTLRNKPPVVNSSSLNRTQATRSVDTVRISINPSDENRTANLLYVQLRYYYLSNGTTGVISGAAYNSSSGMWECSWTPPGTMYLGNVRIEYNIADGEPNPYNLSTGWVSINTLAILNRPPIATFLNLSNTTARRLNDTVVISFTGYDENKTLDLLTPYFSIQFPDSVWLPYSPNMTFNLSSQRWEYVFNTDGNAPLGFYNFSAYFSDNEGNSSTTLYSVQLNLTNLFPYTDNSSISVSNTSIMRDGGYSLISVIFYDDRPVSNIQAKIRYTVDNSTFYEESLVFSGGAFTFNFTPNASFRAGIYYFYVIGNDSDNGSSGWIPLPAQINVSNRPPLITSEGISALSLNRTESVRLWASVSDETPVDALNCSFYYQAPADTNWTLIGTAQRNNSNFTIVFTPTPLNPTGNYSFMFVCTDNEGGNLSFIFENSVVVKDLPPVITNISYHSEVFRNSDLTFNISITDLDELNLSTHTVSVSLTNTTLQYSAQSTGQFRTDGNATAIYHINTTVPVGNYTIRITVGNQNSSTSVEAGFVTIHNNIPSVEDLIAVPAEVFRGNRVNISFSVVDVEDSASAFEPQVILINGSTRLTILRQNITYNSTSGLWEAYLTVPQNIQTGMYNISISITDSDGGSNEKILSGIIIKNIPPVPPSGLNPQSSDSPTPMITWTAGYDSDGDSKLYGRIYIYELPASYSPGSPIDVSWLQTPLESGSFITETSFSIQQRLHHGSYYYVVLACEDSEGVKVFLNGTLFIEFLKVSIAQVQAETQILPDRIQTITGVLHNTGGIPFRTTVVLYRENVSEENRITATDINGDGSEYTQFTINYSLPKGNYNLIILVENVSKEPGQSNTYTFSVKSGSDKSAFPWWLLIIVIVAVILLLVVFIVATRRGKKEEKTYPSPSRHHAGPPPFSHTQPGDYPSEGAQYYSNGQHPYPPPAFIPESQGAPESESPMSEGVEEGSVSVPAPHEVSSPSSYPQVQQDTLTEPHHTLPEEDTSTAGGRVVIKKTTTIPEKQVIEDKKTAVAGTAAPSHFPIMERVADRGTGAMLAEDNGGVEKTPEETPAREREADSLEDMQNIEETIRKATEEIPEKPEIESVDLSVKAEESQIKETEEGVLERSDDTSAAMLTKEEVEDGSSISGSVSAEQKIEKSPLDKLSELDSFLSDLEAPERKPIVSAAKTKLAQQKEVTVGKIKIKKVEETAVEEGELTLEDLQRETEVYITDSCMEKMLLHCVAYADAKLESMGFMIGERYQYKGRW